jgi:4-amino-4-deoxy-L-arabinose transferase-like glycosyltransferase
MPKIFLKYWGVGLMVSLIVGVYFVVRIPNLTLQPIFADEAIYIRWAQVMKSEPTLRFVSLTDGKTPLYMWLLIPFFKIFSDPLLAGRLLSVFAGFVTLIGVLALSWVFFSRRTAIVAAFLIAVIPYVIFFDRMALVDSMLAMFGVWSVFLALLVVRFQRLDLAMFLGFCLGAGMLTKTPGYFNVLVSPLALFAFPWRKQTNGKKRIVMLVLSAVSILIAMFVYNLLRIGPGFSSLSNRNIDYIHPISRLWEIPFDPLISHFRDMAEWFPVWLGWPVIGLICVGIFAIIRTKNMFGFVVLGWALIPLIVEAALLKTFTTRYILSAIPLLLIIAALGFDFIYAKLKYRLLGGLIILVILLQSGWFVYFTHTAPQKAPTPVESHRGYFEDWTAGYGLREIAKIVDEKSKTQKIVIGTGGTFGTLPDGLRIYFDKNPNVVFASGNDFFYKELRGNAGSIETYFVVNSRRETTVVEGLELIRSYPKAIGIDNLNLETRLYRVLPFQEAGSK